MSKKLVDQKGRWRNVTVAFRVSPEEAKLIDAQAAMSGLTKQDYITNRLLQRDVVVVPHMRTYKALKDQMTEIYLELRRVRNGSEISDVLEASIEVLAKEFAGLNEENSASSVEVEEALIHSLARSAAKADVKAEVEEGNEDGN